MEYKELLEHDIATKDFVRSEVAGVHTEVAGVRTEVAGVRTEMHTEIGKLRAEIKEGNLKIIKWFIGTAIATILVVIGVLNLIGLSFQ